MKDVITWKKPELRHELGVHPAGLVELNNGIFSAGANDFQTTIGITTIGFDEHSVIGQY